ncbi:hypothetical protein PQQ96_22455 [Paraburkholderia sediminicola]|uniref:hypothetical protein n=1 Tax=Paraburkholderia sediminicola TaxID=458836 RepID=UPI0038B89967
MNTTNSKETSDRIAHLAAVVLRRPGALYQEKELAGSVLSQVRHLHGQAPAH